MGNVKKSVAERAHHQRQYERRVNNRQMQTQESKIDSGSALDVVSSQALDADLVVMESNVTESGMHDTSSSSGNYITHVVDANIRPINNQVPFAEVNSNTSIGSTNMSHRGGEIDQDAEHDQVKSPLLKAEFLKTKYMVEKEVYNQLSNRFLQVEKHCFSLEISIQQKEECFQTNKPCKNQDSPEFHEFFEINKLKAQLQAKTTLICNLKNQIKSVKEASNEAKVKNGIDVIETINIELEHSVAKLLAANEQLHKENEYLKQTYKEIYDSIKKTRVQNKDNSDSLISQINQKSVKNADLKAQIQEKVFVNAALKNKLRKLKGNSVDTKFAKTSILGKPPLQPSRNHSVVRQPNAFKSERPRISKPRNSQEESHGSNDMAHNHYLEDAKKKTQERNRNSKPSVIPSVRLQNTVNDSTPNPKRMNQTSRSLPTSKSRPRSSKKRKVYALVRFIFRRGEIFLLKTILINKLHAFPCSFCHQVDQRLVPQPPSPTPNVPPTRNDWDSLFCPMFDEYFNPSPSIVQHVLVAVVQEPVVSTGTPSSTRIDQDTPFIKIWELVPRPDQVMIIILKWIYKMKLDELRGVLKTRQIKEQKENGVVELYFVDTEFQLSYIFSKPLGR
ncbi:hypothetical protein Tco_0073473 [Tanacetum coccineum]